MSVCVSVRESVHECVYERVWVGGNTYVSVTTWVCVNVCERVCFYVRVSVCVCTLALEVPVIVVPCRCNKMSCMQWLETTRTYYLLFLKVNDLKSRCSFWRVWGGLHPLPFPVSRGCPHFCNPSSISKTSNGRQGPSHSKYSDLFFHPSSTFKDPCDSIRPTWIIQDNIPQGQLKT